MGTLYELIVDDTRQYMDGLVRRPLGRYPTYDAAVEAAKRLVDAYLCRAHQPGMTPEQLLLSYRTFADNPSIHLPEGQEPPAEPFSVWKYAERRCREICR